MKLYSIQDYQINQKLYKFGLHQFCDQLGLKIL